MPAAAGDSEPAAPAADGEPASADANGDGEQPQHVDGEQGAADGEAAVPHDDEEAPTSRKKVVRQVVTVPQQVQRLSAAVGNLPEELAGSPSFYFVLSRPGKVAAEEMDTAVECGLLSEGPSLKNLEQARGGSGQAG